MKIRKPICITFAGAIGSSKTPIANYLSHTIGLPIYNNDAVRTEIIEDLGYLDNDILVHKRDEAILNILKNRRTFICDTSQDRVWKDFKSELLKNDYDWFIISLNVSKDKLTELYSVKGYTESLLKIDQTLLEHETFLHTYQNDIGLHINDTNFNNRIQLSYSAVTRFLSDH